MANGDRRPSGHLILISPERVFYAGLLGRPRQRISGGFNIYVPVQGSVTVDDGHRIITSSAVNIPFLQT